MSILKLLVLSFIFVFLVFNGLFYTLLQYPCKGIYETLTGMKTIRPSNPDSVDVVYTWVNGSDENLISQLHIHKTRLFTDRNLLLDGTSHRLSCPYPICGFHNHVLLSPEPTDEPDLVLFLSRVSKAIRSMVNSSDTVTVRVVRRVNKSTISRKSGTILHVSLDISTLFINQSDVSLVTEEPMTKKYTVSQVYIASEAKDLGVEIEEYAFIYGLKEMKDASIETSFRNVMTRETAMNISLVKSSSTSFLVVLPNNVTYHHFTTVMDNQTKADQIKIAKAFLIIDVVLSTVLSDLSESRFQDNEELKYSLRSLDLHLRFYRRIFIVTNGQVPSWLDTDHPKITLVFHSQIFPNSSDLPTFNSAAIEANLQYIPDLAPHFIYLNDDVFFGKRIHEEDFFSPSSGYKVYLGWSVPDCVERCPNSWLADGFCDHECNVPECQWDAGDCVKTHGKVGMVNFASLVTQTMDHIQHMNAMSSGSLATCSHGCNHKWLADRYCDNACNVADCGHDLGDCGDTYLMSLPTFLVTNSSGQLFPVENGTTVHILDLRFMIGAKDNVTVATIDDAEEVIASSYTIKYRLLVVLLKSKDQCEHCYNSTNKVIRINVTVTRADTNQYNIITGLILNSERITNAFHNPYIIDLVTTPSISPRTAAQLLHYKTPRILPFLSNSNNSDVSIDQLESLRPLDMSHYRLLLQDGLISMTGYQHLINQLSLSIKQFPTRHVSMTALHSELRLENLSWGFLPWEREWIDRLHGNTMFNTTSDNIVPTMRHIMDLYADSLRYSNRILSKNFGMSQRRVPAHGPHFISTSILKAAHREFHDTWTRTSGHRFRHPFDIQFSFAYFYYLMSAVKNESVLDIVSRVDTDKSGTLDRNELRSLALMLDKNDTISDKSMTAFLEQLRNACIYEETSSAEFSVNNTELVRCLNISEPRPDSAKPVYPFTSIDDNDLAFVMISINRDKVIRDLDSIRKQPKKFFCLNDNLPASSNESDVAAVVRQDLHLFLSYMFPLPSQFERSIKTDNNRLTRYWICAGIIAGMVAIVVVVMKNKRCYHTVYRWLSRRAFGETARWY